jgi:hypothetical protein
MGVHMPVKRVAADTEFGGDVIQAGAGDPGRLNPHAVRVRTNAALRTFFGI